VVAPTRKSTRATVAPPLAAAVAVSVVAAPSTTVAPTAGAVSAMVGTAVVTVTLTADEVAVAPVESVTRAVRDAAPVAVGVHDKEYGAVVTGLPI
jgi:hypothetical protein